MDFSSINPILLLASLMVLYFAVTFGLMAMTVNY